MTSSNGNIFCVTGLLCGEVTGQRCISRTKGSDAEFGVFFDLRLNQQLSKQWKRRQFETPSRFLWHHCNVENMNVIYTFVIVMILEDLLRLRHVSNHWQHQRKNSKLRITVPLSNGDMWILLTKDKQCATSVPGYNVIMLVDDRFSVNVGSVNGLVLLGNKPLPELMFPRCLSLSLADKAKMKLTELTRVISIQ